MPSAMYCGRCLSTFEGNETSCPNLSCGVHRPNDGWGLVLAAGDVLDRHYRIEKCLAVGGAGLTYLARELDDHGQTPIGPKLAIKVLYSARASGSFLRRLSTEAQILQELDHDNIVELRGFVHRAGIEPYLVTRFEEGGSLAAHVDRVGPLTGPVAAAILRQVLRALEMAHQVGVIHRDLKPDNVLLAARTERDEAPQIRIADFGIAKVSGAVGERITRSGAFVGTPEFAAPEQFDGKTPTPATDVFAAGSLLVFLLTGRPPFQLDRRADIEASRDQVLAQMPIRLPPIVGADAAVQAALQQVVDTMTRIDPRERATVEQVLAALDPLVRDTYDFDRPPLPTVPPPPVADAPPPPPVDAPPPPPDDTPPPPPTIEIDRTVGRGEVDRPPAPPPTLAGLTPMTVDPGLAPGPDREWTLGFARAAPTPHDDGEPDTSDSVPPPPPEERGTDAFTRESPPSRPPTTSIEAMDAPGRPPASPDPTTERVRAPSTVLVGSAPPAGEAGPVVHTEPPETVEAPRDAEVAPPPPPVVDGPPAAPPAIPSPPATPPAAPLRDTPRSEQPVPVFRGTDASAPARESAPPARAATPPPAPPVVVEVRSGGSAGLAGCFGLSLFGMGTIAAGGFVLVGILLVVVAAGAGWFRTAPSAPPPIVAPRPRPPTESAPPSRYRDAPELPRGAQERLQRVVTDAAPDIGAACGRGGQVSADVLVDRTGWVVYAEVTPQRPQRVDAACVSKKLQKIRVRMPNPQEGRGHVTFEP